jgi:hypothetical protein
MMSTLEELDQLAQTALKATDERPALRDAIYTSFRSPAAMVDVLLVMASAYGSDIFKTPLNWAIDAGYKHKATFSFGNNTWQEFHNKGWCVVRLKGTSLIALAKVSDPDDDSSLEHWSFKPMVARATTSKTAQTVSTARSGTTGVATRQSRSTASSSKQPARTPGETNEVVYELDKNKAKHSAALLNAVKQVWKDGDKDVTTVLRYMAQWYAYGRYETPRKWAQAAHTKSVVRFQHPAGTKWVKLRWLGWDLEWNNKFQVQFASIRRPAATSSSSSADAAVPAVSAESCIDLTELPEQQVATTNASLVPQVPQLPRIAQPTLLSGLDSAKVQDLLRQWLSFLPQQLLLTVLERNISGVALDQATLNKSPQQSLDHIAQLLFNAPFAWSAPLQQTTCEVVRNEIINCHQKTTI